MKLLGAVFAGLLAFGCGGSDKAPTPGVDFTCDASKERVGTYLMHMAERAGGDCGPVKDSLVRIGDGIASTSAGGQCVAVAPPTTSEGGCKIETTARCMQPDGTVTNTVGESVQDTADGSRMSGIADITVSDASGAILCSSTFDVTYTRQ